MQQEVARESVYSKSRRTCHRAIGNGSGHDLVQANIAEKLPHLKVPDNDLPV
jgi:hypothetical protein